MKLILQYHTNIVVSPLYTSIPHEHSCITTVNYTMWHWHNDILSILFIIEIVYTISILFYHQSFNVFIKTCTIPILSIMKMTCTIPVLFNLFMFLITSLRSILSFYLFIILILFSSTLQQYMPRLAGTRYNTVSYPSKYRMSPQNM